MLRRGMRIAFLHLSPAPGQFRDNIARIEAGIARAADLGAEWVLTPELATSGYTFHLDHGVDWIGDDHERAVATLVELAASANVTVFLGMPERDAETGSLYNALRVIDRDFGIIGAHRKVNALRVGSEAWSSQGTSPTVVDVHHFGPVGLLICADACSTRLGEAVKAGGARAIVSAANWVPGDWGPEGEWERMSELANAPVLTCNRTGMDKSLSFEKAESVIAHAGVRLMSVSSIVPTIIIADWDFDGGRLAGWFSEPLD